MFDDMFKTNTETKSSINNNNNNDYKKKHFSKSKKINLFKETPAKKAIDLDKVEFVNDIVIMMHDNNPIDENTKERISKLLKFLKEKDIPIRILCVNSNSILPMVKEIYETEKVKLVKPWKKFCDVDNFKVWTPSNINIENTANYVPNFDKLPTGLKYIKSSYLTMLTSYTGKHFVKYVLVNDPYYNKKDKVDFNKSKETFDMYRVVNAIGSMSIYNIAMDDDLKTFVELVSK